MKDLFVYSLAAISVSASAAFAGGWGDLASGKKEAPIPASLPGKAADGTVHTGCSPEFVGSFQKKMTEALKRVASCLDRLNPTITKEIKALIDADGVELACDPVPNAHGATTAPLYDPATGKTSARITLTTDGVGASRMRFDHYAPSSRLFHELIHGADLADPHRYWIASLHRKGFPDMVYSCQYACYKNMTLEDIRVLDDFEKENGDIPQDDDCAEEKARGQNTVCSAWQKYRHVCRTGMPPMQSDSLRREKLKGLGQCVMNRLLDPAVCSAPACAKLQKESEFESAIQGEGAVVRLLGKRAKKLVAAWKSRDDPAAVEAALEDESPQLTDLNRALYETALKKPTGKGAQNYFDACLK